MFIIILSLAACYVDDGEWGNVDPGNLPATMDVIVSYSPGSCLTTGQVATITIFASQGEAALMELDLNRQVDFGHDIDLVWTDGKDFVIWDHKPLFPRKFAAERETEQLPVVQDHPVMFTLSIDPKDCRDFGHHTFVDHIIYWDVGLEERRTLQVNK